MQNYAVMLIINLIISTLLSTSKLVTCQLTLINNTGKTIFIAPLSKNLSDISSIQEALSLGILVYPYQIGVVESRGLLIPQVFVVYEQNPRTAHFRAYHIIREQSCAYNHPVTYREIENNRELQVDATGRARLIIYPV